MTVAVRLPATRRTGARTRNPGGTFRLERGDVWLVRQTPSAPGDAPSALETVERALAARPVVIVSPSELPDHLATVIVVPLSRSRAAAPFRPAFRLDRERAVALVDQVCTIERARLLRRVGRLGPAALENVLAVLQQTFAA